VIPENVCPPDPKKNTRWLKVKVTNFRGVYEKRGKKGFELTEFVTV
jgi:hypothetical protein